MGYKQTDNPFTKLGDSFTNPKRVTRNNKALEWNAVGFEDIINKTADGAEVISEESSENKTGNQNEGKIPKGKQGQDGINASTVKKIDDHNRVTELKESSTDWRKDRKARKSDQRKNRQAIRRLERGERKGELSDEAKQDLEDAKERRAFHDTQNTKGLDKAEQEGKFQKSYKLKKDLDEINRQIENDPDLIAEQKEEDRRVQKEVRDRQKRMDDEDYNQYMKDNPELQNYNIGPTLGSKKGAGMYKQNNMENMKYGEKHLKSKGSAFPMVAQQPQVDPYGQPQPPANRAGRGAESNQLTNDPNINQPMNKVANSTFNTNERFANIASSAGQMDPQPMQPQHKYGHVPAYGQPSKELVGNQHKLPEHLKAKIESAPGMYETADKLAKGSKKDIYKNLPGKDDSMKPIEEGSVKVSKEAPGMYNQDGPSSFKGLVSKLESEGKSKEAATKIAGKVANMKMKGAGSGPTAAQKARMKGPGMHGDHAHTKVTSKNLKSAEKDDAAHMDYLKRDINYDAKHGGSKKQMLNDEKHISKLAGDLKYDHKHHGRKYDNV